MRQFRCGSCRATVAFDAQHCSRCETVLGYVPELGDIRKLLEVEPSNYRLETGGPLLWRCLNASWGCNWMLPTGADIWCRACRLTRGRPDETDPIAVEHWGRAEAAKRRVIHQLRSIGLPITERSDDHPDGLVFDLVHVPGALCVTGHHEGVVTIDLTEGDDRHRDAVRRSLDERYRTMIGHFRHEIGHHLWSDLVGCTDRLSSFRELFGDERVDYAEALERHHGSERGTSSRDHVSPYATAHPHEDWAESFAHYLHVHDAAETARSHGWSIDPGEPVAPERAAETFVSTWVHMASEVNDLCVALGGDPVYPFHPSGVAVDKLQFVHDAIADRRSRRNAEQPPATSISEPAEPESAPALGAPDHDHRRMLAEAVAYRERGGRDLQRARQLRREVSDALRIAASDHLTGALLRREGFQRLESEISRCRRTSTPLLLGFVDVDGLKAVNDTRGHLQGDRLLVEAARVLRGILRSYDELVRFGGDEFVFSMVDTTRQAAIERIEQANDALFDRTTGTISAGFAELEPRDTLAELVSRADADLYLRRRQPKVDPAGTA